MRIDPDRQPDKRFGHELVRPAKIGQTAATSTIRDFCLLSTLEQGGTASAVDIDTGDVFDVVDVHGEYYGVADEAGGCAHLVNGEWRIIRLTCPGFVSSACNPEVT